MSPRNFLDYLLIPKLLEEDLNQLQSEQEKISFANQLISTYLNPNVLSTVVLKEPELHRSDKDGLPQFGTVYSLTKRQFKIIKDILMIMDKFNMELLELENKVSFEMQRLILTTAIWVSYLYSSEPEDSDKDEINDKPILFQNRKYYEQTSFIYKIWSLKSGIKKETKHSNLGDKEKYAAEIKDLLIIENSKPKSDIPIDLWFRFIIILIEYYFHVNDFFNVQMLASISIELKDKVNKDSKIDWDRIESLLAFSKEIEEVNKSRFELEQVKEIINKFISSNSINLSLIKVQKKLESKQMFKKFPPTDYLHLKSNFFELYTTWNNIAVLFYLYWKMYYFIPKDNKEFYEWKNDIPFQVTNYLRKEYYDFDSLLKDMFKFIPLHEKKNVFEDLQVDENIIYSEEDKMAYKKYITKLAHFICPQKINLEFKDQYDINKCHRDLSQFDNDEYVDLSVILNPITDKKPLDEIEEEIIEAIKLYNKNLFEKAFECAKKIQTKFSNVSKEMSQQIMQTEIEQHAIIFSKFIKMDKNPDKFIENVKKHILNITNTLTELIYHCKLGKFYDQFNNNESKLSFLSQGEEADLLNYSAWLNPTLKDLDMILIYYFKQQEYDKIAEKLQPLLNKSIKYDIEITELAILYSTLAVTYKIFINLGINKDINKLSFDELANYYDKVEMFKQLRQNLIHVVNAFKSIKDRKSTFTRAIKLFETLKEYEFLYFLCSILFSLVCFQTNIYSKFISHLDFGMFSILFSSPLYIKDLKNKIKFIEFMENLGKPNLDNNIIILDNASLSFILNLLANACFGKIKDKGTRMKAHAQTAFINKDYKLAITYYLQIPSLLSSIKSSEQVNKDNNLMFEMPYYDLFLECINKVGDKILLTSILQFDNNQIFEDKKLAIGKIDNIDDIYFDLIPFIFDTYLLSTLFSSAVGHSEKMALLVKQQIISISEMGKVNKDMKHYFKSQLFLKLYEIYFK